jgi:hypothetical protein
MTPLVRSRSMILMTALDSPCHGTRRHGGTKALGSLPNRGVRRGGKERRASSCLLMLSGFVTLDDSSCPPRSMTYTTALVGARHGTRRHDGMIRFRGHLDQRTMRRRSPMRRRPRGSVYPGVLRRTATTTRLRQHSTLGNQSPVATAGAYASAVWVPTLHGTGSSP